MGDDAGALRIEEDVGRAGGDIEIVPVAPDVGIPPGLGRGVVPALAGVSVTLGATAQLAEAHGRGRPHGAAVVRTGEALEDAPVARPAGAVAAAAEKAKDAYGRDRRQAQSEEAVMMHGFHDDLLSRRTQAGGES